MSKFLEKIRKYQVYVKLLLSSLIVFLMVLLAEVLKEPEIIFPETAALVLGGIVSEKMVWRVSKVRMLILMTVCSAAGFVLASIEIIPIILKIIVGLIFVTGAVLISRTTMLPALSACILPILMNSKSIVYPFSVMIITLIILFIQLLLEKFGLREKEHFEKLHYDKYVELLRWGFLLFILIIISDFALKHEMLYLIAPPLMVTFCEFSYSSSPARKSPFTIFVLIGLCACAGAFSRLYLCEMNGIPLFVGAGLVIVAALCLLTFVKIPFPPAAALSILPFIIPYPQIAAYPFYVMAGAAVLILAAMLYGKLVIIKTENEE